MGMNKQTIYLYLGVLRRKSLIETIYKGLNNNFKASEDLTSEDSFSGQVEREMGLLVQTKIII